MVKNYQTDFIANYVQSLHDEVNEFSRQYPELWILFNMSYELVQATQATIAARYELSKTEIHRLMMWQSVLHYQTESLILMLSRKLDAGYALLRLATELSRDISSIGDDQSLLDMWMNNRLPSSNKKSMESGNTKKFKFDTTSAVGATVYRVYKLCSDLGVHGHIAESMHSVPANKLGDGKEEIVMLKVTEKALLEAVQIWLLSFGPIQHLCLETFKPRFEPLLGPVFRLFYEWELELGKASTNLADWLKNSE